MIAVDLGLVGVAGGAARWHMNRVPHALLTGQTGSGKTFLASEVLVKAAASGAGVWLADGKGAGDYGTVRVTELALGSVETLRMIDRAADEVQRRIGLCRKDREPLSRERPLLVVVDELAAVQLRRRGEDARQGRDRRDRLLAALGEVSLLGRVARVHLLVVKQRPDAEMLPGFVRDQFGLRIALGWMSSDGYRMVFGMSELRPPLRAEPGIGWISGHDGHRGPPELFQVTSGVSKAAGMVRHGRR